VVRSTQPEPPAMAQIEYANDQGWRQIGGCEAMPICRATAEVMGGPRGPQADAGGART